MFITDLICSKFSLYYASTHPSTQLTISKSGILENSLTLLVTIVYITTYIIVNALSKKADITIHFSNILLIIQQIAVIIYYIK